MNSFFILGAIFALLAVIIGAFGAHGLEKIISDDKMLMRFNTGVEYQFYHAFAIFIIAFLLKEHSSLLLTSSGIAFILGILLFSGSLYSYVLTGNKIFGMITPIGGLAFIMGWILMLIYFFKPHE
jgi:uncharacterized membrane protein YgdD (TMEM256/DUF423 family)